MLALNLRLFQMIVKLIISLVALLQFFRMNCSGDSETGLLMSILEVGLGLASISVQGKRGKVETPTLHFQRLL